MLHETLQLRTWKNQDHIDIARVWFVRHEAPIDDDRREHLERTRQLEECTQALVETDPRVGPASERELDFVQGRKVNSCGQQAGRGEVGDGHGPPRAYR